MTLNAFKSPEENLSISIQKNHSKISILLISVAPDEFLPAFQCWFVCNSSDHDRPPKAHVSALVPRVALLKCDPLGA